MTVESTTARINQTSDGIIVTFNYDFLILDESHMQVYLDGDEDNPLTGFTVAGVGNQAGGSITFSTAPAAGTLTLARIIPRTQSIDYIEYGKFPSSSHEQGLDLLVMMAQELFELYQRAPLIPISESTIDNLPSSTDRASKYLGFNALGQPTAIVGQPPDLSPPTLGTGDSSKILQVNDAEDGYELRKFLQFEDTPNTVNLVGSPFAICKMNITGNRFIYTPGDALVKQGDVVIIYKTTENANTITFSAGGTQTVEGGSNYVIVTGRSKHVFVLDKFNNWVLVEQVLPPTFKGCLLGDLSTSQSIPNATYTKVNFDIESYDTNGFHDNVTNNTRITIPADVSRVKLFIQVVFAANSTGYREVRLVKNGALPASYQSRIRVAAPNSGEAILHMQTPVIDVVQGDYFEFEVYQDSTAALNLTMGSGDDTFASLEVIEE